MHGTKCCLATGYWCPPRVIISTAPCCTKKLINLQKICAILENNQSAHKLITSLFGSQVRAHYYYCSSCCTTIIIISVWPVPTINICTTIRARTLLLLLYPHCCKSMALARVGHVLTMTLGRILEQSRGGSGYWGDMSLFPAVGNKQSNAFRKYFKIPKSNLASIWRPIRFRNFDVFEIITPL